MIKVVSSLRSTEPISQGAILLDLAQGQLFSVNAVAEKILRMLRSEVDETEVVNQISAEFHMDPQVVRKDFEEFVSRLRSHKLLVLA